MPLVSSETVTSSAVRETTAAAFRADVISASLKKPVIVNFWGAGSDPGKKLQLSVEKAVNLAKGKATLVNMNVDAYPQIAQQLGIQSIPAIIAFDKGQPVDGFVGALPESQIVAFIERLVGPVGDNAETVAAAEAMLDAGDAEGAAGLVQSVIDQDPEDSRALSLAFRCLVALADYEGARGILELLPEAARGETKVKAARAALDLAQQSSALDDTGELEKRVEKDPLDHQARYDLALALNAKGDRAGAAEHLLSIMKTDRAWNEDGARKQLLHMFEAWGPMDPITKSARRRLSAFLFS